MSYPPGGGQGHTPCGQYSSGQSYSLDSQQGYRAGTQGYPQHAYGYPQQAGSQGYATSGASGTAGGHGYQAYASAPSAASRYGYAGTQPPPGYAWPESAAAARQGAYCATPSPQQQQQYQQYQQQYQPSHQQHQQAYGSGGGGGSGGGYATGYAGGHMTPYPAPNAAQASAPYRWGGYATLPAQGYHGVRYQPPR